MPRMKSIKQLEHDIITLEMLAAEGIAKESGGQWEPAPWAKDIAKRLQALTASQGWKLDFSSQVHWLLSCVIKQAREVGINIGLRKAYEWTATVKEHCMPGSDGPGPGPAGASMQMLQETYSDGKKGGDA